MHDIPHLDRNGLRRFGLIFGAIIGAVFGVLLPWIWDWQHPVWPWIITLVFIAWAMVAPGTIEPFYRLWMRVGLAINWVVTRLVLGIVYFFVVLPMGLFMKLVGKDPLSRELDAGTDSYRVDSANIPKKSMENPF